MCSYVDVGTIAQSNKHPFSDLPGGRPPTVADVARSARAGATWVGSGRDLPDPLGWADLAAQPEETAKVIRDRAQQDRMGQRAHRFPLPKANGTTRTLLQLDHFDELTLRALAGRMVGKRRVMYDKARVLSSPIRGAGPGWRIDDVRPAFRHRQTLAGRTLRRLPTTAGMGVTDTSNYYASVDVEKLGQLLSSHGAPTGAVQAAVALLTGIQAAAKVPGLPIGCEASAFFGNVYLSPADKVFSRRGMFHIRWTDDVWAFATDQAMWDEAIGEYETALASLGLTVNRHKTSFLSHDEALLKIANPVIDYLLDISGGGTVPAGHAADELRHLMECADLGLAVETTAIRFCLGVLKSRGSALGLPVLEDHPELLDIEPTATGQYLVNLALNSPTRKHLDEDWLVARATRLPTGATLAGSVQALRTLAAIGPSRESGKALLDLATDCGANAQVPLQQWAAQAWHQSGHASPNRAGAAAEAAGHLAVKRVLTAGLRRWSDQASASRCLASLGRQTTDLSPTIAWARDH